MKERKAILKVSFFDTFFLSFKEMAILANMDVKENKYLQRVNLEALQKETGMSLVELANMAGIGPKVIYKWQYNHKDSSRPSYDAFVKLFEAGATVETLFGVEYKGGVKIVEKPMKLTNDDISAMLAKAAEALKNSP